MWWRAEQAEQAELFTLFAEFKVPHPEMKISRDAVHESRKVSLLMQRRPWVISISTSSYQAKKK